MIRKTTTNVTIAAYRGRLVPCGELEKACIDVVEKLAVLLVEETSETVPGMNLLDGGVETTTYGEVLFSEPEGTTCTLRILLRSLYIRIEKKEATLKLIT